MPSRDPSGSRLGAPGARLPSDVITLDPHAPRPAGPAYPQAQGGIPGSREGGTRGGDPQQQLVAGDPGHVNALGSFEPPGKARQRDSGPAHNAQSGGPRQPGDVSTGGDPGGHDPASARAQDVHGPLGLERDQASPSESGQGGGRGGRPRDVRSLLGLGPTGSVPDSPRGAPPKVGKTGRPAQPKAKRAPRGSADQRTRKPRSLPGPSGDPKGHIQRWLVIGVATEQTGQGGAPAPTGGPRRQAALHTRPLTNCGTGPQPESGRILGVPGSSADPPPGSIFRRALDPAPGDRGVGHGGQQAARCVRLDGIQGGLRAHASRAPPPDWGTGTCTGADAFSEDGDFLPLLSDIPDLYPSPGGEDHRSPPVLVGGVQGSWSLTRQPAACEHGALPDSRDSQAWSLSLSFSPCIYGASIAQLVEPCSWIRRALSSILASATTEWLTKKYSLQNLRRNLKPEIPQVFRTSAAPVQE